MNDLDIQLFDDNQIIRKGDVQEIDMQYKEAKLFRLKKGEVEIRALM